MKSVNVIIETPRGSAEKYDYDQDLHLFKLKKILPAGWYSLAILDFFINYSQLEEKKLHILCMMTAKEARQIMGSNKKSKLRKR